MSGGNEKEAPAGERAPKEEAGPEASARRAKELRDLGRPEEAARVLARGLQAPAGERPRLLAAAVARAAHWDPTEAREAGDELLSLRPEWPAAWLVRAELEWELEQYDEADVVLVRGLGRIPGSIPLCTTRARMAGLRGRWPEALDRWTDLQKRHPESPAACAGRVRALRHLGRLDEAERGLEGALAAHPEAAPLREECARLREAAGDWEGAAQHWQELIRLRPDHEPAHWSYAESLRWRGRGEEADVLRRQWLERHPDHPDRLGGRPPAVGFGQLKQDLWALAETGGKKGGYFVELGAGDGVYLSNTYLLERCHRWSGICAEANTDLFRRLRENRTCTCRSEYVFGESGRTLTFLPAGEYGTARQFAAADMHESLRRRAEPNRYEVSTISLNDLLEQEGAPPWIDYISVDTEGSEYDILRAFAFERWSVGRWTIEHNYSGNRRRIARLMEGRGYRRIRNRWEDWYVRPGP